MRFNQPSQIKYIIEASGAKFEGIQKIKEEDKYAVATDRQTGSTYYLPIEKLTKKKVQTKLNKEREKRLRE